MNKIPLEINNFAEGTRIIFRAFIKCEMPKIFGLINFIVDTGSPITLISIKDRERLRISKIQMNTIPCKKNPITIGGGQVKSKIIENVKIKIGDFDTEMPVHIVNDGEGSNSHPSILGIDFLLHNKMKLTFNPGEREAYLEY